LGPRQNGYPFFPCTTLRAEISPQWLKAWPITALLTTKPTDCVPIPAAGTVMTYIPELDRLTEKVIFGSDWPGMRWIRRNMEAIGKLPLAAEGVERILGGNAARLLRL
jgi:hypothetical protein